MDAAASAELQRYCGAKAKRSATCKKPAGWGTPHPGRGVCRLHGGMLPHIVEKYRQEEARKLAVEWGIEADIDPFAGILQSVRLAYGSVAAFRSRLTEQSAPDSPEVIAYMAAQKHAAQIAKMAIDAGIAEREVRIMERLADSIAQAFEDAVAAVPLEPAAQAQLAERFAAALEQREGGVIEGRESGTNGA